MISQIEQQIITAIKNGDELAFEGLFKSLYSQLLVFALRFVEDDESAEEIVQDTFFQFWESRDKIEINTSLKAYLYKSVRNASLNFLKHEKVVDKYRDYYSNVLHQDELSPEDWMTENELSDKIQNAIGKLPPERKKVFEMSRFEGLKYREIAEKLNISVKTVENQMGKALKFLREELKEYLPFLVFLFFK